MRDIKTLVWCTLICFLVGCSNYDDLREGALKNNQRVDTVLENYKITKETARDVEEEFKKSVLTKDIRSLVSLDQFKYVEFTDKISKVTEDFSEALYDFLTLTEQEYQDQISSTEKEGEEGVEESHRGTLHEPIESIKDFIDSAITTHYFIDDTTGRVDQTFIMQLPHGTIKGLIISWLGGVPFGYKTFGTN